MDLPRSKQPRRGLGPDAFGPEPMDSGERPSPFKMRGLMTFVGFRLHRKIFAAFGAAIVITALTVWTLLSLVFPVRDDWLKEVERYRSFSGNVYAHVWDDPVLLPGLSSSIVRDLEIRIEIRDVHGRQKFVGGPSCSGGRTFVVPVHRGAEHLGDVTLCNPRSAVTDVKTVLTALFSVLFVLWILSGLMARKISKPLWHLANVAYDIGCGRFGSRVELSRREPSELKVVANTINDMASRIEKQLNEQRELLAAVSHELRTPLGHLRVLLDLGRSQGLKEKTAIEMEREIIELDDMVGELLASSRLTFDAMEKRSLDALDVAARALDRTDLNIDLLDEPERDIRVFGDATLLGRALANLLNNAKRHAQKVIVLRVNESEDELEFVVGDEGPGFVNDDLDKVFQSFYRGQHRAGSEHESLGLGLSLVRRIAEAHGGSVFARNRRDAEGNVIGAEVGFTMSKR